MIREKPGTCAQQSFADGVVQHKLVECDSLDGQTGMTVYNMSRKPPTPQ